MFFWDRMAAEHSLPAGEQGGPEDEEKANRGGRVVSCEPRGLASCNWGSAHRGVGRDGEENGSGE